MLCGLAAVKQASVLDGLSFDPFSLKQDGLAASEVARPVAPCVTLDDEALVVAEGGEIDVARTRRAEYHIGLALSVNADVLLLDEPFSPRLTNRIVGSSRKTLLRIAEVFLKSCKVFQFRNIDRLNKILLSGLFRESNVKVDHVIGARIGAKFCEGFRERGNIVVNDLYVGLLFELLQRPGFVRTQAFQFSTVN